MNKERELKSLKYKIRKLLKEIKPLQTRLIILVERKQKLLNKAISIQNDIK